MNIASGEGRAVGLLAGLPRHRRGHRGHLSSAAHTGHTTHITDRAVEFGLQHWLGDWGTLYLTLSPRQARARHDARSEGMVRTAQRIVAQAGVAGLFRGLLTKLLQSMVAAGFMFMSYENIFEVVNRLMATSKVAQKIK